MLLHYLFSLYYYNHVKRNSSKVSVFSHCSYEKWNSTIFRSCYSFKWRLGENFEKINHSSGSPSLSTPLRRERELFWIKELGTAKPYGFNDQIKGVGTLSSTSSKKTNVYTLFNKHQRRKRSHGKRHYNKKAPQPESSIDALITLIDMTDQPEGVHKIKTHLFSMSLPQLSSLQEIALESTNTDFSSAEYRVTSIILNISHYRLFKPVKSDVRAENPKHFMKIKFLHKGIDAINLPQLLRSQSVMDKIPAYFKDKEPPIISYQYTNMLLTNCSISHLLFQT